MVYNYLTVVYNYSIQLSGKGRRPEADSGLTPMFFRRLPRALLGRTYSRATLVLRCELTFEVRNLGFRGQDWWIRVSCFWTKFQVARFKVLGVVFTI